MRTMSANRQRFRCVLQALARCRCALWLLLATGCGRTSLNELGSAPPLHVGGAASKGGVSGQGVGGNAAGAKGTGGAVGSGGVTTSGGLAGSGENTGSGGLTGSGGVTRTGGVAGTGGAVSVDARTVDGGSVSVDTGGASDVPLATGGTGGGGLFDAKGVDAPALDAQAAGETTGTGGAAGAGGATGAGGTGGTGATTGTGGTSPGTCTPACTADQDCIDNTCVLRWGGMTCTTTQDCPSYATCCDGSNESCDGTRLPAGDGTNSGEFVVSADGLTVTDTITGLLWQRDGSGTRAGCASGTTCTWAEAKAYCASLVFGGLSAWRLPAEMELSTIVDFTRTNPSIDPTAFPNTPADAFWTSSPDAGSSGFAWAVCFDSDGGYSNQFSVGNNYRVRCVR